MSANAPTALVLTFARRGEEKPLNRAVEALREEFPDAAVIGIGTSASAPVQREAGIEEVILYGDGRGTRTVVREVRARRPEAVSVVYRGPGFAGHLKLEGVALLAGARQIYRFVPESKPLRTSALRLVWSVLLKTLEAGLRLVAAGFMCGAAWCWLRVRQTVAGGNRESRY